MLQEGKRRAGKNRERGRVNEAGVERERTDKRGGEENGSRECKFLLGSKCGLAVQTAQGQPRPVLRLAQVPTSPLNGVGSRRRTTTQTQVRSFMIFRHLSHTNTNTLVCFSLAPPNNYALSSSVPRTSVMRTFNYPEVHFHILRRIITGQ